MSAPVDPAFSQLARNFTGFYIWRIEKMQVVPVPKDQYGIFYQGDSYIIFSSSVPGDQGGANVKVKEVKAVEQHIHYWLGSEASKDEMGTAAYKTVELDGFLGGAPIQHREMQGLESNRFRSYFPSGIRLLQGGVASGFNKVTNIFEPRLYSVKGKKRPVVRQLSNVSWSHMNHGDAFIIQMENVIFVWEGKDANKYEKLQAAKVATQLKSESSPNCAIIFVTDEHETELTELEQNAFFSLLPIQDKTQMKSVSDSSDDLQDRRINHEIKLYRCSDDNGTLRVTEVKEGPLFQSDLDSNDSFIIDNATQGIWVWIGKKASSKERVEAMRNAQGFIKKKEYPEGTQITRVIDGGEPVEFVSLFKKWKVKDETVGLGKTSSYNKLARTIQTSFDASALHEQPAMAAKVRMVDDGSGSKTVYKVHNFDLVTLPLEHHGTFFENDCYVIQYKSMGPTEQILVYFWLGSKSNAQDQGTAALKAVELDDAVDGKAVQIRVVQGKEPPHFIAMFGGEMIIYMGDADDSNYEPVKPYLLQVRGSSPEETRAIQVPLSASSLNSNDVFVLSTNETTYLWCGKGCTGDERESGKKIAINIRVDCVSVYEGQEKNDFWEAIGGKQEYANDPKLATESEENPPRLFRCSNATGNLKVEEILNFSQIDLIEDDVMLLDVGHTLFLWFGQDSNKEEQKLSFDMSIEYLKTDPCKRDEDTPIVLLKQNYEPPTFTGFFGAWDPLLWANEEKYEDFRSRIQSEQRPLSLKDVTISQHPEFDSCSKYSIDVLAEKDTDKLPPDVNPTMKEVYLSQSEFESVFKMSFPEFKDLPQWKKTNLKKSVGLF